ncbi:MAG: Lrp/AsnC family transcriptional regulator [Candidatus Heimdallarchaeota archaeon]|nr:Lrp/AsnC family transcriptional regulator [Candidatus Heimdallarchaeota archaeon]
MISAYLFINLSSDNTDDSILDSLQNIEEVKKAYRVYGTYDVVILMEAENTKILREVTLKSIRQLKFVHSTMTLLSLMSYEKD